MNNYIYEKMTFKEINNILEKCYICVLAVVNNTSPYMVPMYYEYDNAFNEPKFILESKDHGQKINYLKNNSEVSLYIQYNDVDSFKTIVIGGKATIKKVSNSCSYPNMVKIKVCAHEISGRIYTK